MISTNQKPHQQSNPSGSFESSFKSIVRNEILFSFDVRAMISLLAVVSMLTGQIAPLFGGNPTRFVSLSDSTDASAEGFEYDKNSNLTRHTRPNLRVINYAYDALNRLTGKTYPQNTTLNTTFAYDLGSRLVDANNNQERISRSD